MPKVIAFNIDYDTDGEEVRGLSKRLAFNISEEDVKDFGSLNNYMDEVGADLISDKTGWLVDGFCWKRAVKIKRVRVF